jgi:hypothetical protein
VAYVARSSCRKLCIRSVDDSYKMRWLFSLLLLAVIGLSNALSTSGSRLLVILDDVAEKEQYSKLLGDLSGM